MESEGMELVLERIVAIEVMVKSERGVGVGIGVARVIG